VRSRFEKTSVYVLKSRDTQGRSCVALVLSQNALMETNDTHEPYPGVALSPAGALLAAEKILAVVREIAAEEKG
jgi:hypothetical protein